MLHFSTRIFLLCIIDKTREITVCTQMNFSFAIGKVKSYIKKLFTALHVPACLSQFYPKSKRLNAIMQNIFYLCTLTTGLKTCSIIQSLQSIKKRQYSFITRVTKTWRLQVLTWSIDRNVQILQLLFSLDKKISMACVCMTQQQ